MDDTDTSLNKPAQLQLTGQSDGKSTVLLSGEWTLSILTQDPALQQRIKQAAENSQLIWDLRAIAVLDNATALWLWQAWGQKLPAGIEFKPEHRRLIEKWQNQVVPDIAPSRFFP